MPLSAEDLWMKTESCKHMAFFALLLLILAASRRPAVFTCVRHTTLIGVQTPCPVAWLTEVPDAFIRH